MISSFSNPLVKRIKRYRQKKHRVRDRVGFVEGLRPVLSCLESAPHLIDTLLIAPDLLTSEVARAKVESFNAVEMLSADVFRSISERDNPTGCAALIRNPAIPLDQFSVNVHDRFVLLDRLSDPGNLGTICRAIDAAGGSGVILYGGGVDVTHPIALKASMGTAFSIPIAELDSCSEIKAWALTHQIEMLATSAKGSDSIWHTRFTAPLLLMMGNEQAGLSAELVEAADQLVQIPMYGQATSLNVAMATTVALYEIARQLNG